MFLRSQEGLGSSHCRQLCLAWVELTGEAYFEIAEVARKIKNDSLAILDYGVVQWSDCPYFLLR